MNIPGIGSPIELDGELKKRNISKKRAKSFSSVEQRLKVKVNVQHGLMLYPFTELEKMNLWDREIKKFESDLSIDPDDELLIDDLRMQNVFEFQDYLKFTLHENMSFEREAEEIIEKLDELLTINDQVTKQTEDFQAKSDRLVTEVDKLGQLQTELSEKLSYFESLDPIVQTLNTSSSGSIVVKSNFQDEILGRLDKCIGFVNDPNNQVFKEAEVYRFRFKQCMVRALTLIRNYVTTTIREVERDVERKITEQKGNEQGTTSRVIIDAMIYGKFTEDMSEASRLFRQLYRRSSAKAEHSDEYFGLLNDCYNQYFKSRRSLLSGINDPHSDNGVSTSETVQTNLSYFSKLLEKESQVFKKVFLIPETEVSEVLDNATNISAMNTFFETLVDPLYEVLRDRIIRENNIGELCECVGVIEGYFDIDDEHFSDTSRLGPDVTYSSDFPSPEGSIDYQRLFKMLLEDTQSRLVFRVRRYIDGNVVNYQRTGNELAIGNRKDSTRQAHTFDPELDTQEKIGASGSTGVQFSMETNLIYPPVIKSVKLLSKIYQLVSQNIFDDLANSIVHLAIVSLKNSFDSDISLESKLYEIRNLMFLKDYMSVFDIEGSSRETTIDFSGLTNFYHAIFGGRKNTKGILSSSKSTNPFFVAIPTVVTDFFNCKAEIQSTLRDVVHDFINESKKSFLEPLSEYPERSSLSSTMDKFMEKLHKELPRLGPRIADYIEDQQTLYYLIDGIQGEVIEEYERFYNKASETEKSAQIESLLDGETVISTWGSIIAEMLADMDSNPIDSDPDLPDQGTEVNEMS
ncbi:DEKNAAC105658 [Brettanomyces naardenensis]|uniref:Conserved oligomeric Golgi complex subunit 3 n=1 Tax=Brettanomyces naardenensis TaxID=13370 RepID=A0A448YTR1_BRENA|nr:DEKNAAC105658 [Brettanomyces naardenensis]